MLCAVRVHVFVTLCGRGRDVFLALLLQSSTSWWACPGVAGHPVGCCSHCVSTLCTPTLIWFVLLVSVFVSPCPLCRPDPPYQKNWNNRYWCHLALRALLCAVGRVSSLPTSPRFLEPHHLALLCAQVHGGAKAVLVLL